MIYHGKPPFLECSSIGERRFSAFHARIVGRGGRTIEELYQGAKMFSCGSTGLTINEAKGKRPSNLREVRALYTQLWDEYMHENLHLLPLLTKATGLSDRFGQRGSVCQATELWRIRNTWPAAIGGIDAT